MITLLRKYQPTLFYSGTLVSSVGSMTFNVALMAFMIKSGFSLIEVSLIIGFQRLIPIFCSFFLGQWTDQIAPRTVVLWTELGAALGTLGILWSWKLGHAGYPYLLAFCLIKAAGLQFQTGSRNLISKLLSAAHYSSNAKNAMWLNQATQGATLFAGVIGFVLVAFGSLTWAIWFDFATFLMNGMAISILTVGTSQAASSSASAISVFQKFKDFYRYNPKTAKLDALLAIAMLGSASFRTRVVGSHQEWNPIFLISYGLAVWLAGAIERSGKLKGYSSAIWLSLALSFAALGFAPETGWLTFAVFLIRDTSYWLILHRISGYIQMDTPATVTGSVSSARNFQMISILSAGEVLVGAWQSVVPLSLDGTWRALFCFGVAGYVALSHLGTELSYERPRI